MRTTTMTSAATAAGCALILLLAGCSNDGSPDDSATDAAAEMGPLSAYFENIAGSQDQEDWDKLSQDSEEAVATCMREQGFEYTPQDMTQGMTVVTDEEGPEYGSEEYAAENGYGMTTQMGADAGDEGSADEWVDPNADYVASMSESEMAAYQLALYGEPVEFDESDPDAAPEYSWETSGCQGKAQHEVYDSGVNAAYTDPAFVSLQEEMNSVWEGVTTDPKMTELDAAWSSCMAEAGFEYATQQDAVTAISDKLNALYTASAEGVDADAALEVPAPDEAALAELRTLEVDTAVADAKCKKSTDYEAKMQKVQFAAEQAFVDAHKAELDAWSEKYSQASK